MSSFIKFLLYLILNDLVNLKKTIENILEEIYHNTKDKSFLTMDKLEINFGMSGFQLRNYLEDLKESGYVIEAEEGFQISNRGILYSKSNWI